jgi:hypothetical protein
MMCTQCITLIHLVRGYQGHHEKSMVVLAHVIASTASIINCSQGSLKRIKNGTKGIQDSSLFPHSTGQTHYTYIMYMYTFATLVPGGV